MDDTLKYELLDNLKEDYLGFWLIYYIVKTHYNGLTNNNFREKMEDAIRYLCNENGVTIGESKSAPGGAYYIEEWNLQAEEKFEKIVSAWKQRQYKEPGIGDIEIYFTTL